MKRLAPCTRRRLGATGPLVPGASMGISVCSSSPQSPAPPLLPTPRPDPINPRGEIQRRTFPSSPEPRTGGPSARRGRTSTPPPTKPGPQVTPPTSGGSWSGRTFSASRWPVPTFEPIWRCSGTRPAQGPERSRRPARTSARCRAGIRARALPARQHRGRQRQCRHTDVHPCGPSIAPQRQRSGKGRNSVFLASHGLHVTGLDVPRWALARRAASLRIAVPPSTSGSRTCSVGVDAGRLRRRGRRVPPVSRSCAAGCRARWHATDVAVWRPAAPSRVLPRTDPVRHSWTLRPGTPVRRGEPEGPTRLAVDPFERSEDLRPYEPAEMGIAILTWLKG